MLLAGLAQLQEGEYQDMAGWPCVPTYALQLERGPVCGKMRMVLPSTQGTLLISSHLIPCPTHDDCSQASTTDSQQSFLNRPNRPPQA